MRFMFLHSRLSLEGDPLGVMQLSAILKRAGHTVGLTLLTEDYLASIRSFRPDMLGINLMSSDVVMVRRALDRVREHFPGLFIIVGGPHPTFDPSCLTALPVDAVCVGEGDEAVVEALEQYGAKGHVENIPNIGTSLTPVTLRPLVADLDALPFLDREIVYSKNSIVRDFPLKNFAASRGCHFKCTYCFNHAYNAMYSGLGHVVRRRSVDHLIAEMVEVAAVYPTSYIKISDDSFVYKVDTWLEEFTEKYRRKIGLPFYCLLRADVVTPDMVRLLREAGCRSVCMSIEAGNEEVRRDVLNRKVSNNRIIAAFDLFNEAGIAIYTNSMLAMPRATLADDIATLDLNIRCRPALGHFTIMAPFPGTRIFDMCMQDGILPPIEDDGRSIPISTGELSKLTTYTDEEKNIQKNIVLLGPLVIRFPVLRGLFLNYLSRVPSNSLYKCVYALTKNLLFRRIVRVRMSPLLMLRIALSQVKAAFAQVG
jgi:radical SAM superfamily enzyme YgiQ (UPF0313 family)